MKPRHHLLAVLALVFLSWNASAQGRCAIARTQRGASCPTTQKLGALERTRLLEKGRGKMGSSEAMRLGSVDRRSLLTTGKSIYPPKPKRRHHSSRR